MLHNDREKILVTNMHSCLGRHLLSELKYNAPFVQIIRGFEPEERYKHIPCALRAPPPVHLTVLVAVKIGQARDDVYADDGDTPSMMSSYRCGLAQRLADITSVVHMATYCDYSIQPDIGKMERINVEGR
jgi:hypothetical protein